MNQELLIMESRRRFLKRGSVLALALPTLPLGLAHAGLLAMQRPSRIELVGRSEPGEHLLMRGMVCDKYDKPAPNVKIFLYQTDAAGYYSQPVNNPRQARLHGTVWSDAEGRYAFSTIRPAHYAGVNPPPPMHIHVHLEPPGLPNHWVDSYYFAGDPHLRPADLASFRGLDQFSNIVRLAPDKAGVLQGVRNFRLDPALAERNQLVNGWYRTS
jgi:protocatechuate 3,4-dioxygenase beta subunit